MGREGTARGSILPGLGCTEARGVCAGDSGARGQDPLLTLVTLVAGWALLGTDLAALKWVC